MKKGLILRAFVRGLLRQKAPRSDAVIASPAVFIGMKQSPTFCINLSLL